MQGFLCDVHISYRLSKFLNQEGYNSTHINEILNKWNTADNEIIKYADDQELTVITKDHDFQDSFFISKRPKKLVLIELGNISNDKLIHIFNKNIENFNKLLSENEQCFIKISPETIEHFI